MLELLLRLDQGHAPVLLRQQYGLNDRQEMMSGLTKTGRLRRGESYEPFQGWRSLLFFKDGTERAEAGSDPDKRPLSPVQWGAFTSVNGVLTTDGLTVGQALALGTRRGTEVFVQPFRWYGVVTRLDYVYLGLARCVSPSEAVSWSLVYRDQFYGDRPKPSFELGGPLLSSLRVLCTGWGVDNVRVALDLLVERG